MSSGSIVLPASRSRASRSVRLHMAIRCRCTLAGCTFQHSNVSTCNAQVGCADAIGMASRLYAIDRRRSGWPACGVRGLQSCARFAPDRAPSSPRTRRSVLGRRSLPRDTKRNHTICAIMRARLHCRSGRIWALDAPLYAAPAAALASARSTLGNKWHILIIGSAYAVELGAAGYLLGASPKRKSVGGPLALQTPCLVEHRVSRAIEKIIRAYGAVMTQVAGDVRAPPVSRR